MSHVLSPSPPPLLHPSHLLPVPPLQMQQAAAQATAAVAAAAAAAAAPPSRRTAAKKDPWAAAAAKPDPSLMGATTPEKLSVRPLKNYTGPQYEFKKCALVGNAQRMLLRESGAEIDQHEVRPLSKTPQNPFKTPSKPLQNPFKTPSHASARVGRRDRPAR
eukprot:266963-Prorocentrum_minimum.AAC.1